MSTTRTLHAVPAQVTEPVKPRTDTEEKLWQALGDNPGSTAAALSAAAGIGRSTAPKILTRWERDGVVTRTAGIADGGARPADRWAITSSSEPFADQPTDDQTADTPPSNDQPAPTPPTGEPSSEADAGQQKEKTGRLSPGELHGMVKDYLRDNDGEFSPTAIGKALGRSSGAVYNALERMVDSGDAVRTCDKPRTYRFA